MKRLMLMMMVLGAACLWAGAGQAVEPAYEGRFGNPEEPALRPYKWFWSGVRALGHQTKSAFVRGNMNTPFLGSVEGLRGVRKGTLELGESTYKGAVFAPVEKKRHLETHKLNAKVDDDLALRNLSDAAVTWYAYPMLKYVDHKPLENDEKVEIRLEAAEDVREIRKEAADARAAASRMKEDKDAFRVRRAQERYVGGRIPFSGSNGRRPARNLLHSAR